MPIVAGADFQWTDPFGILGGDQPKPDQPAPQPTATAAAPDDADFGAVVDTVIGEAGGEGPEGMAAVASVIRNRALADDMSPADVVRAPKQFFGYSNPGPAALKARQNPQVRAEAARIIRGVFSGQIADPTGGADHFDVATNTPAWAKDMQRTAVIGNQVFYRSPSAGSVSQPSPALQAIDRQMQPEKPVSASTNDTSALAFLEPRIVGHSKESVTGMQPVFRDRLASLFQAAPESIRDGLGIFSGYRSPEHQTELWNAALKKYGSVAAARKWVAPPPGVAGSKGSRHNMGEAADVSFNGRSLAHAPAAVVNWLHQNAPRFGLTFPLSNENWHIETVEARGGKFKGAATPSSGDKIVVGPGFETHDPMGLTADGDNPFGVPDVPVPTPRPDRTEQANVQPDGLDQLFQHLNSEQPGRYEMVDADKLGDWRKKWDASQSNQFVKGFKGALVDQNPELLGNALDALGVLAGSKSIRSLGGRIQKYGQSGNWKRQAKVPSIADIRTDSFGDFVSDATDYASYMLGQGLGSMAPSVAGGVAGSLTPLGPIGGLVAGAIGPSYIQNLGDLYGMLRDDPSIQARVKKGELTEREVASWAAAGAVPMAALDSVSIGKILGPEVSQVKRSIVRRIVKGVAEGALTEGGTEGLQQVIEEGVGDALGQKKPLRDQAISVLDNAVAGALAGGAAGGAAHVRPDRAPATNAETPENVTDLGRLEAPQTAAPETPPAPAGPLRAAVEHGAARATARVGSAVPPDGAPPIGATVRVDADGVEPFMAIVDGYSNGEALLFESGTGEVMQVPVGSLTQMAPPIASGESAPPAEPLPADSTDAALEPQAPVATETRTELPERTEQTPAMQRVQGSPAPGQRVIVDSKGIDRFSAQVESYEEGNSEALVRTDDGRDLQVPVTDLYTSKLTPKQAEAAELKRNPPVEHDRQETDADRTRKVVGRTMVMPDAEHARLYDLALSRQQAKKLGGATALESDRAMPPEQQRLADHFGITPQALGALADDYRYRVQRAARESRTDLPIKMPPLNAKRLEQARKERGKADAVATPAPVSSEPAPDIAPESPQTSGAVPDLSTWWDRDLTPLDRQKVLSTVGVKRSPKVKWQDFSASIRKKLATAHEDLATAADEAAVHEAATSPRNDLPEPSQAQKEAGNYKVGRLRLGGMEISVENPEGSERRGTDGSGKPWSVRMKSHYGYIRGTVGRDKDHIDTFVKPGTTELADTAPVFIVDQKNIGNGQFDEHKVMLGFDSEDAARKAYLANYTKGWRGLGKLTATTLDGFKQWLEHGDTTKPFFNQKPARQPDSQKAGKPESVAASDTAAASRSKPAGRTKTPPKLGAKARIARSIVGVDVGGIVTPSADVGYAAAGGRYRVTSIDRSGSVHIRNADGSSGTSWSFGELLGARKRGATFTAEAAPAADVQNVQNVQEPEQPAKPPKSPAANPQRAAAHDRFADNKIFTADKVEAARARLKAKLNQLNAGVDPETLVDGMTIAGAYIEAGVRDFAGFAKRMTDDFGDVIKPYLLSFWEGARNYPGLDTVGMTSVEDSARQFTDLNRAPASRDQENVDIVPANPENANEPPELERPGARALEGAPAGALSRAEEGGQAGEGAGLRGGADVPRDQRTGGGRIPAGRGVPDGQAGISVPAREGADRNTEGRNDVGEDDARGPGRSEVDADRRVDASKSVATPAAERPAEYTLSDADELGNGGAKTKFRNNVAAIELLRTLEQENRPATRDEQSVLAKWVGWGGLRNAFPREDGSVANGWTKEAKQLKALLTPEEYRAAESSTRNAHYTSPEVVKAIWSIADRLGFAGGRVLEPSVGAGNFIGLMPGKFRTGSQVTGVELDRITGGIAKNLYPHANIQAPVGFQDLTVPDDHFDLVVGNPPFGSERLYDKNRRALNKFSIHNFFFAKSVDALKPNGVLAMVVTNYFLDAADSRARSYIARKADLVGAIRLPNNAFLKNAGTEVTTDIVIFRKRAVEPVEKMKSTWTEVGSYTDREGRTVPLNAYFVAHPEMMLGEFGAYGTMYGRAGHGALIARDGEDLGEALGRAIRTLPESIMSQPGNVVVPETVTPAVDVADTLVGSMSLAPDGSVMQRLPDLLGEHRAEAITFPSEKAAERVAGMVRVRDAFARLRHAQIDETASDEKIANLRGRLNALYDGFVRKHGPINADANRRLFRDDPTWPQISALEDDFDKGVSRTVAKTTGEKPRPPSAKKAPIFFKRTQEPYRRPTSASSAKDALATVLADVGHVDLDAMSRLYRKDPATIVDELGPLLFRTPSGAYETADQYLSGNVKQKLGEAERAAAEDPAFRRNVAALRDAIPADIEPVDIDVKPGAPWIPSNHIVDFIHHVADGKGGTAFYSRANAKWAIEVPRASSAAEAQWATERASVSRVLDAVLNGQTITIYDRFSDGTQTVNPQATDAANEKVERVKAEWKRWVWEDDQRREHLARLYNDTFNTDVVRRFDGSHLTLPGKVGDDIISLRPHQKNAVWRVMQSPTVLFDHTVGAGKTFAAIAAVMEMRRTGQAKKPVVVVPNHLVGQWAADFVKLYPGAKVLAASKKDFAAENRKRLFARVATGDWDAVVVAHSSFGRIGVDPKFEEAFIRDQIADLEASMKELREATGEKSRNVSQLAKWRENMESRLKRLQDAGAKDVGMTFDEMGIDALVVDEAHEFKNLGFATSMQRVAGLGNPQGSQKAADLYMKVKSVQARTGGRNILFLTGTPLSNTMAEMFTVQRYLDGDALKNLGVSHFDAWARVFGEVVTDWELSPSGQYKLNSRFAKFVNMPELMQRYLSFADVVTNDDIKAQLAAIGKRLPLPKVKGGKPTNIVVERSPDQAAYVGEPTTDENGIQHFPEGSLVYRAEHLPRRPEKGADNMLKIMSDARKAALDMRLIDPSYEDVPGSKVHIAADNMKRLYDAWNHKRGTQLVFIDLSTPKKARAKEEARIRDLLKRAEDGDDAAQQILDAMSPDEFMALDGSFSVYDDLKQKLVNRGIPADEVAFIHDANTELQKEELFGKVRSGRIRLLFGSTAKMGAGTNVQNRLVALHHLDAPWRPSDLEQRDGRGIRQGNELYAEDPDGFEIEILRYATKNTLDARQWQTIEGKARFIQQMRKGGTNQRQIEDIAGEVANAAEMKAAASGNPLILEEMDLRQKVRKLEGQSAEHDRAQHRIRMRIRSLKDERQSLTEKMPAAESDAAQAKAGIADGFNAAIDGVTLEKPKDMGAAVIAAGRRILEEHGAGADLGQYAGFPMVMSYDHTKAFTIDIEGANAHQVYIDDIEKADPVGVARRIMNTVKALESEPERRRERLAEIDRQAPALEKQIGPFEHNAALEEAQERHREVLAKLQPKKLAAPSQPAGEKPRESVPDMRPVATITGEELGVDFHGGEDMPSLRKAAFAWYEKNLIGRTVKTRNGLTVSFNHTGAKKSVHKKGETLLRAVPAIPAILERGEPISEPTSGRRPNVRKHIIIGAPVDFMGTVAQLAVSVRELADGRYQYNLTFNNEADNSGVGGPGVGVPGGRSAEKPRKSAVEGAPGAALNLFQWAPESNATSDSARVRSEIDAGPLGAMIGKLVDSGRVTIDPLGSGSAQAFTLPDGSIHLVADRIAPGEANAVLLHEAFHSGRDALLAGKPWQSLMRDLGRIRRQFQQSAGRARVFYDAAASRVARAEDASGPMSARLRDEEFGAYAIEEYERAPKATRDWVDRLLGAVKAWALRRFGRQIGSVTPAQLRSLAISALRDTSAGRFGDGTIRRSVAADRSSSGPVTENRIIAEIKGRLTDLQPKVLATIPLNYFTELKRPNMTAVDDYLRVKRQLDSYRGAKHADADKIAGEWLKYARLGFGKDGKARAAELADLMHDATLAGVDPAKTDQETTEKPRYDAFRKRFMKLPPAGRALYVAVRDAYKAQAAELDSILLDNVRKAQEVAQRRAEADYKRELDRINAASMPEKARKQAIEDADNAYKAQRTRAQWSMKARLTKMRQAFEASRVEEPYFPLARFGRYFVTVRDVDGSVLSFSRRERAADRDRLAAEMRQAYPGRKVEVGVMSNASELREAMDPRIVAEIETIVGGAGIDPTTMNSVLDQIWQRYLATMPDLSTRKRFIHRQGVAGFQSDALRAFSSHMFHAAHQMGRLKYGLELQELTNEATDQARQADDPTRGMTLANELKLRHKWVMNPTGSSVVQTMTSAAFVWYLAGTPAAAVVNMTQTPMLGIPILGGRFGSMTKAALAIARAAKDSVAGRGSVGGAKLTADERRALDAFNESGLIDRTRSHDLAGVGETGVNYSPLRARVMSVLSYLFHRAEVCNREVTALAAYRMARKAGQNQSDAINTAHDLTWKVHFDYSNASRPRMMQNDVAKLALVFRSYNINMLYRAGRDLHQAFKGETPQARKEARYQLAGIYGMMALMAGTSGVIGFNIAMAIAGALFGDDDDPVDFKTQFRKSVLDILGPEFGGAVLDGVPGHYLGIDLTDRIGMPDLWFRSPYRDLSGQDEYEYWVFQTLGATVGIGADIWRGAGYIADGNIERGIETIMPKYVRDVMKAYRYEQEGVTSLRGDQVVDPEAIDPWDIIAQAIGFTPAKVTERYDTNSALKNAEHRILLERRQLINRFALAVRLGDEEARAEAIEAIKKFNHVPINRPLAIKPSTLHQSLAVRARNAKKRQGGVLIGNRRLGKELRERMPESIY